MEPTTTTRAELHAVRLRRAELRETLNLLEAALAAPARGRAVIWGEAVHAALVMLADDFRAHVEVTEGPDGLHQDILSGAMRLAHAVQALTTEHVHISDEAARLVADSAPPVGEGDIDDLRERATALMVHIIRHRQRGADLIYEAYALDIGGGD